MLALSVSTNRALFLVDKTTKKKLLAKDPVAALLGRDAEPPVILAGQDDKEMLAAIAKARKTWARFATNFQKTGRGFVKYPMTEGEHTEHLWVLVTKVDKGRVWGTLSSEPVNLTKVRSGAKLDFPATAITDWIYKGEQGMQGGFTAKVLMKRQQQKHKNKGKGKDAEEKGDKDGD